MRGDSSRRLTEADLSGEVADLRERTFTGVRWLSFGRGGVQIAALLSTIAMARLVPPEEFGRAAVAAAVWHIGGSIGYEGFGASVVQRPRIDRRFLEAATFLSLVGGVALTALTIAVLYPVLSALIDGRTAMLTAILCGAFVIQAAATTPKALLRRRLDFRRLAINEVCMSATTIVVSLALALGGLDAEAIVIGLLAGSLVGTLLAFAVAPAARPRAHREPLRQLAGFALSVQGSSFLHNVQRHSAVAVVGAAVGPTSAGFFQRAHALGMEYHTRISSIMLTVAFPLYSRMGDLQRAVAMRRRVVRVHAATLFPLLLLIAATAPVLVPWLYGEEWRPAAEPAAILALAGLASAVLTGTGPLIMAAGKPHVLLRYNAVAAVAMPLVLWAGASFGLREACLAFLGYHAINLVTCQYFLLNRACGIPVRELIDDTLAASVAGLALFVAAKLVAVALEDEHAVLALVAASVAGGTAYVLVLRLAFPASFSDVSRLVDRVTGVGRPFRRPRVPESAG